MRDVECAVGGAAAAGEHEAVGALGVGRDRHPREVEGDARRRTSPRDVLKRRRRLLGRPELPRRERGPRLAALGQTGLQLERVPPADDDAPRLVFEQPGEGRRQVPLADVAPRAGDVGEHVEGEREAGQQAERVEQHVQTLGRVEPAEKGDAEQALGPGRRQFGTGHERESLTAQRQAFPRYTDAEQ